MQEFEIDGSGWHTVPGTNMRRPCQFLNKKVQAFYHGDSLYTTKIDNSLK